MEEVIIREVEEHDKAWVSTVLKNAWGSMVLVARGKTYDAKKIPGFIAQSGSRSVGLITYTLEERECIILSVNSLFPGRGIGGRLLKAVEDKAREAGCTKLIVTTTNDNTSALRFYQKKGFRIHAIYIEAVEKARTLKPEIPLVGIDGIEIRDEIELQLNL